MRSDENKLKPCPFCGGMNIKIDKCSKRVRCGDCFATSGIITRYMTNGVSHEEAAIKAWNERCDNAVNE